MKSINIKFLPSFSINMIHSNIYIYSFEYAKYSNVKNILESEFLYEEK